MTKWMREFKKALIRGYAKHIVDGQPRLSDEKEIEVLGCAEKVCLNMDRRAQ